MNNYKRQVSYIYRYDNNIKTDNVGYVRTEVRNGKLKFALGIRDCKLAYDGKFKLCMYSNGNEGIFVDNIYIEKGMEEVKLETSSMDVFGSGRDISAIEGIFLWRNNKVAYVSQWSDRAVDFNELIEVNKQTNKESIEDAVLENTQADCIVSDSKVSESKVPESAAQNITKTITFPSPTEAMEICLPTILNCRLLIIMK